MFNLFALTDDPVNRRLKFSLSAEVQQDLTAYLQQQESTFNKNCQDIIPFDGKYKPDLGEVLEINEFDDIDSITDAITNPLSIPEVSPTPESFSHIKALFSGYVDSTGKTVVLIQHFDKKRVISPNGLSIFHAANVYKKIEGVGLTIDNKLTATLSGNSLKFNSFHIIRQVFDLSGYYMEATDVDIHQFAALPTISVENAETLVNASDSWVRRKLWLISQSQILQLIPIAEIKAVAAEFNIHLETTMIEGNEKIKLPETKKELKTILRFLDEDYYKSPLLQNYYITNSKRPA